jgi:flagellar basal body-associated protein FliL
MISLLVAIYVIALLILIGAFFWYGARSNSKEPATGAARPAPVGSPAR